MFQVFLGPQPSSPHIKISFTPSNPVTRILHSRGIKQNQEMKTYANSYELKFKRRKLSKIKQNKNL